MFYEQFSKKITAGTVYGLRVNREKLNNKFIIIAWRYDGFL